MNPHFIASGFILLFLTHGCMTTFDPKDDADSSQFPPDSSPWLDQDTYNGNMDGYERNDACPEDPNKMNPGECGCGVPEGECDVPVDTGIDELCDPDPCVHGVCLEGDDAYSCHCETGWTGENCDQNIDECPSDPQKTKPGECGCGVSDEDSDNDGTPDCDDECPYDSGKTKPGECGCGTPEGACAVVEVNSNLQVYLDGQWRGVCCRGGEVEVSNDHCRWDESERVLKTTDLQSGNYTELDCPENGQTPADCACRVPGESLHGVEANGNRNLKNSLRLANGGPIYPNSGWETCIDQVNGEVRSRWTTKDCPHFRLVDHY